MDVTEYITVDWNENYHHGIYKFTPQWLEYTNKNGKTIKRKSNIYNLRAINDPFTTDFVKKKARVKIGSASQYVPLGEKKYIVAYTYDMGFDPYKKFDEFIFHAYGDYWGTEIKNASMQIHMPKSIDGYNINFFADKYRKDNVTNYVDYKIIGNTIYAKFNSEKYRNEQYGILEKSLTVDIELPENYFVGGSWNYSWWSFAINLIIIFITICTIFRWKKYGKDYPKRSKTVEFYPPNNLSSAEIGYIYNKQTNKKLTIALIIQLASKGYIKIDEMDNKGKYIKITKLDSNSHRTITIKKLKDADEGLTKSQCGMMNYLFKESNTKTLDNVKQFIKVKKKLVDGGYIKILKDSKDNGKKLQPLSEYEKIVYDILFENKDEIIVSEHKTLYKAFNNIEALLETKVKDLVIDKTATSKMISSIFITILVLVLHLVGYYLIEDMDPSWGILYSISFISIFINLFFTVVMKRKTDYGEEIIAQIYGFRDFLIKVEKPKLEELVSQNPQYFYDILPYTYVLNVSKTWIKKFEDIPMPEMDMGSFNYSSDRSYYSIYDNVQYPEPVSSSSSSSSGGCSSCGGGCSSCGGGCSSCGGGGSW